MEERRLGSVFLCISLSALALALAACATGFDSNRHVLTTVAEVREVPPNPGRTIRVRISGIITYSAAVNQQIFLQDATGGVRLAGITLDPNVGAGDVVEIEGTPGGHISKPIRSAELREALDALAAAVGATPTPSPRR